MKSDETLYRPPSRILLFFFFNDTATTEIYTLSLHDALPISICQNSHDRHSARSWPPVGRNAPNFSARCINIRSEEHTSELQSRQYLVCRLLLEKKKKHKKQKCLQQT